MPDAVGVGGAKLILFGEHAVVHGYPALALGVDRTTTVSVTAGDDPAHPGTLAKDRRVASLTQSLFPGLSVHIRSDIPVGRGMGSSAALAVALVRAAAAHHGEDIDADTVFRRSLEIERIFHGNPSGVDNAVSDRGGALLYRRGPPAVLTPLPCPDLPLVVLDSGSSGDTASLVAGVAARRPAIDEHLAAIGAITEQAAAHLHEPDVLGPLMYKNHERLAAIGVSTPQLDQLVALAMQHGALGAKLSGAGGGGVVVALARQPLPIIQAARAAGFDALSCRVRASR